MGLTKLAAALTLATAALLGGAGAATAATASAPAAQPAAVQAARSCGYYSGTATFRLGSTGSGVREIQCLVNLMVGGKKLDVDGIFGANTDSVIRSIQRCAGLAADGIVGPKTWQALRSTKTC
ncbi:MULTISPECIES: peptidoglycan-binding protein [Actinosynnema]|uniref:peptidoglycan-binding domain-containing protein n=1 Tax=Actinosynnema TaxID=40566 RepID=UPI0020A51AAB|nr:peptidoglycan-binding protein [Actinosynnema pretiosum]MCP2094669.1 putative peptidoglycan binding domain-containing protein [Actinosynnema pretiosum]